MEALIFYGGIALVIFLFVRSRMKKKEKWEALPKDGPMKVSIGTMEVPAGSFNSKRLTCGLDIDVRISQADWKAIANAGLMQHLLFEYPGPSSDMYDPENVRQFLVEHLNQVNHIGFNNVIKMQDAKEKLILGLHNLKAHIEPRGPETESFEI